MKTINFLIFILCGAGLLSCSSYKYTSYTTQRIDLVNQQSDVEIDSLIAPYRRELSVLMNKKIGSASQDLSVARPSSPLGNWVADCVLNYGKDSLHIQEPVVAILNTGGIRYSISAGDVTVGDIYKVMPFDNQIIALKLPINQMDSILNYLKLSGGEPIAGFVIFDSGWVYDTKLEAIDYFWVITTDFLANGGDKMTFFKTALERKLTAKLVRDVLLENVIIQKSIPVLTEKRIEF